MSLKRQIGSDGHDTAAAVTPDSLLCGTVQHDTAKIWPLHYNTATTRPGYSFCNFRLASNGRVLKFLPVGPIRSRIVSVWSRFVAMANLPISPLKMTSAHRAKSYNVLFQLVWVI